MSLPVGCRIHLDPRRRELDDGRLLVGGSPLTAMRLSRTARDAVGRDSLAVTGTATAVVAERLVATNLAHPDLTSLPPVAEDEVTVVVPVRDRAPRLDRCLAALHGLRVLVVDDASHDPAAVAAVVRARGAELLALPANVGPAVARNLGLARVTTAYVAFVDSDVEVGADALLLLARHLADPGVALVGPRIVGVTRSAHPRWFERYDSAASSLDLGDTPATVRPGAVVGYLPSACLVGRTALIDGFAPDLRVGEDVDLVWRLIALGHRVRYEPGVTARHDVRESISGWLGRKFAYGSSGAALAQRHGSRVAPAILSPTMALAAATVLLRRRWTPAVVVGAGCWGARSVHRALPAELPRRDRTGVSVRLAGLGLGWAVRQESALLLRHWWPATALGCLLSARVRRAVGTALVVDTAVALHEHRTRGRGTDGSATHRPGPVAVLAGRRLDDLAYGAGLWWGVWRAASPAALLPRRPGEVRARCRPGARAASPPAPACAAPSPPPLAGDPAPRPRPRPGPRR